jgi:hypothetical protein
MLPMETSSLKAGSIAVIPLKSQPSYVIYQEKHLRFFEFCKAARWIFCSLFFIAVPDGEPQFRELCLLRVQE